MEPTPTDLLDYFFFDPPQTDYDRGFLAAVLMLDGGSHPRTTELKQMLAKTSK